MWPGLLLSAQGARGADGHDDAEQQDGSGYIRHESGEADVFVVGMEPAVADAPNLPRHQEKGAGAVFFADFCSSQAMGQRLFVVHGGRLDPVGTRCADGSALAVLHYSAMGPGRLIEGGANEFDDRLRLVPAARHWWRLDFSELTNR